MLPRRRFLHGGLALGPVLLTMLDPFQAVLTPLYLLMNSR